MKMKNNMRRLVISLVIAIVVALLPIAVNNDYWTVVFVRVMLNIIVALGLNFITGLIGQMNLGMAGIYALGAYSSALLVQYTGCSPWLGLVGALVMGLIIGLVLGYPSLRLKGVYLSLTTIGFTQIVTLFLNNMTGFTGGSQGVKEIPNYNLFGFPINSYLRSYYLYAIFAVIAFFIAQRIIKSKWGRLFRSLRDNVDAVEMTGVNIASAKIKAFTISAIFGCIAGALYAHFYGYINPSNYTLDMSMNYVLMLLVGGLGSAPGAIMGACVVTILPEPLRGLGDYYLIVFYGIIFIGILLFPNGWIDAFSRGGRFLYQKVTGKKLAAQETADTNKTEGGGRKP